MKFLAAVLLTAAVHVGVHVFPYAQRIGGAHDPVGIALSEATCDRIWGGANPASTIEFDVPDGYGVGTRVFERVSEEWWACYVTLETLRCEREGWCE